MPVPAVFPSEEEDSSETLTPAPEPDASETALSGQKIGSSNWSGLDLGSRHVITRIGYTPQASQESKVVLAMLEGANSEDFSDALPLGIIKESATPGAMNYLSVNCSRGFRYVRYVSPHGVRYNLAELAFFGYEGAGNDSRLCQLTNLPTVVINTNNGAAIVSKTKYIFCTVNIISDGGKSVLEAPKTEIRGRGNASWDFPKKPYRINFAEKHSPLGAPSFNRDWTLINNYGDKTLMRNILAFEVSRRVGMAYTPFCAPVDVVLNGEYQGCYQLCDQVEVAPGRVDAKDGYLIEIDAYAEREKVHFYSAKGIPVTVKYPDDSKISSEQRNFIKSYFGKMEASTSDYSKYLDIDSFLRNFIVGEFCGNTDTYWSVYMYKDGADGKLFTGPSWDYDLSFENDQRTAPVNNLSDYIYATRGSVAAGEVRSMVNRIVKNNASSKARLKEIWNGAKPSLADLNDYVDSTAALLEESQRLNFKRWPILSERVHQNPRATGSYSGEVKVVKDYITRRLSKFDELVNR